MPRCVYRLRRLILAALRTQPAPGSHPRDFPVSIK
nr:MAG TPA: hypothetical protein [Caudoviricetes sp.]